MLHGKSAPMMEYDAICTFVFKDYKDFARFAAALAALVTGETLTGSQIYV